MYIYIYYVCIHIHESILTNLKCPPGNRVWVLGWICSWEEYGVYLFTFGGKGWVRLVAILDVIWVVIWVVIEGCLKTIHSYFAVHNGRYPTMSPHQIDQIRCWYKMFLISHEYQLRPSGNLSVQSRTWLISLDDLPII